MVKFGLKYLKWNHLLQLSQPIQSWFGYFKGHTINLNSKKYNFVLEIYTLEQREMSQNPMSYSSSVLFFNDRFCLAGMAGKAEIEAAGFAEVLGLTAGVFELRLETAAGATFLPLEFFEVPILGFCPAFAEGVTLSLASTGVRVVNSMSESCSCLLGGGVGGNSSVASDTEVFWRP